MKKANLQRMIKVAKLYYEEKLTQDEISKKLKISVPQISRIVTAAKNEGYVKTIVVDPFSESNSLKEKLLEKYSLKDTIIVNKHAGDQRATISNIAQAGADYLLDIVQANDIVSIAYSSVIYKISQFLPKTHIENLSFVQPIGSLFEQVKGYQYDTLRETSIKMDASYYYFPAPAMVKDKYVKDMLHKDPSITWIMEMAEKSNITFFSVEDPHINSIYVKNGYYSSSEIMKIKTEGAVAEIFGHFINRNGEINDQILEDRVMGMDISHLRTKDYAVCVSAGEHLVDSIQATLAGKYCNVLITDTATAKQLLDLN